jgi:hypothetical protein
MIMTYRSITRWPLRRRAHRADFGAEHRDNGHGFVPAAAHHYPQGDDTPTQRERWPFGITVGHTLANASNVRRFA